MTTYTAVKCPDGQFRCTIFGLGPYIVDYSEQVWLGAIVSNLLRSDYITYADTLDCFASSSDLTLTP